MIIFSVPNRVVHDYAVSLAHETTNWTKRLQRNTPPMKRPSRASSSRPVSGHYRVLIVPLQFPGSKRPDSSALHRAQHDLMFILQAASLLSHADISKPVECSPRKAKHEGGRLHRRLLQPQAIWLFDKMSTRGMRRKISLRMDKKNTRSLKI